MTDGITRTPNGAVTVGPVLSTVAPGVGERGLEPPRAQCSLGPEPSASTNSATRPEANIVTGRPGDCRQTTSHMTNVGWWGEHWHETDTPDDLAALLDAHPDALATYRKLPSSHRREYIEWIDEAKRPDTRRRRIQETIGILRA